MVDSADNGEALERGTRRPNPIDVHVGNRVRLQRMLIGISQEKLGERLGLTFQQVQKYEKGINRIGASRLFEFSKVLDVPVSYFFEEMPANVLVGRVGGGRGRKSLAEPASPFEEEKDPMIKRETLELVRAYYKITDGRVRKRLFETVKAVGAAAHVQTLAGRRSATK